MVFPFPQSAKFYGDGVVLQFWEISNRLEKSTNFQKSSFVIGLIKRINSDSTAGCRMDEIDGRIGYFGNNSYMAAYSSGGIGTGKAYYIARFGFGFGDFNTGRVETTGTSRSFDAQ